MASISLCIPQLQLYYFCCKIPKKNILFASWEVNTQYFIVDRRNNFGGVPEFININMQFMISLKKLPFFLKKFVLCKDVCITIFTEHIFCILLLNFVCLIKLFAQNITFSGHLAVYYSKLFLRGKNFNGKRSNQKYNYRTRLIHAMHCAFHKLCVSLTECVTKISISDKLILNSGILLFFSSPSPFFPAGMMQLSITSYCIFDVAILINSNPFYAQLILRLLKRPKS